MIKQNHRDRCRILLLRDFGIPWVASGEGGKGLSSYFFATLFTQGALSEYLSAVPMEDSRFPWVLGGC